MSAADNNSIFTIEELEIMERTKKVRLDVITSMTKDRVPEKTNELRVLNEYMNSLDDTVQRSVANRLKHEETSSKEAIMMHVAATLQNINSSIPMAGNRTTDLHDDYIPVDIVPGETDINPTKLLAGDFLPKDDD